jgi:hypothetical protein
MLQTVVEVAAEKNSTLIMPMPVELLRFFDRMAPAPGRAEEGEAPPAAVPEPEPVAKALEELPPVEPPPDPDALPAIDPALTTETPALNDRADTAPR